MGFSLNGAAAAREQAGRRLRLRSAMLLRQPSRLRISRRGILAAALAAFLPAMPARAEDGVAFVRDLYARQVALHNARGRMAEADFLPLFARTLRTLMQAPRPGLAHAPAGPILNAFFGWGILPGQPVTLQWVRAAAGGAVAVEIVARGEPRQITLRLVREQGLWKIADISYGHGESLLAYYRRITKG